MKEFDGQVVAVSGAAGGMGRQICSRLLALGCNVSGCSRREILITEEEQACFSGFVGDLSSKAIAGQWIDSVVERWGRLDAVVNTVGLFEGGSVLEVGDADLDRIIANNFKASFFVAQAALLVMSRYAHGVVVNFASAAAQSGPPAPAAAYAATKGAVISLTRALAREFGASGVRVNAISPGPIDAGALAVASEEHRAAAASRTLLGRVGTTDDICDAVLYLISERASFVTGQVLNVNGGSVL